MEGNLMISTYLLDDRIGSTLGEVAFMIQQGISEGKQQFSFGVECRSTESEESDLSESFALQGYQVTWEHVSWLERTVHVTKVV
jgi:hypothetical protein